MTTTEHVENARVERINIGSGYHDGRGFFTICFVGDGWGQGIRNAPFVPKWIDDFIAVCGAADLFGCTGKLVRLVWAKRHGACEPIIAVRNILESREVRLDGDR